MLENEIRIPKSMKKIELQIFAAVSLWFGIPALLVAQHLDVEGHSKIRGQLNLGHMYDSSCVYIGYRSGLLDPVPNPPFDTIGFGNTFVGARSGEHGKVGDILYNTALGFATLWSNLTGNDNTACGTYALLSNESGSSNTANGHGALLSHRHGSGNTAQGAMSLYSDSIGVHNTAVGYQSSYFNKTGLENSVLGWKAGYQGTTGRWNTMLGSQAGRDFITGDYNVFIGQGCGLEHTGGSNNVFVGHAAGRTNSNSNNVFIGDNAGRINQGSGNVIIGFEAAMNQTIGNNFLWIENSSSSTPLIFGDFSSDRIGINCTNPQAALSVTGNVSATGTVLGSQVACSSDRRYKKNIVGLENTLARVMQLKPVRYYWKKEIYPEKQFSDQPQVGFIAQEVEELYPELVHTSEDGYKSIDYGRLTVILTEAIKEMSAQHKIAIRSMTKQQEALVSQYEVLQQRMARLEARSTLSNEDQFQ